MNVFMLFRIKNINISSWLGTIKNKIKSNQKKIIYIKNLQKNKIVKENLDLYLLKKSKKLSNKTIEIVI